MIAQDPPQSWYAAVPFERLPARYIWWGVAIHTRQSYQTALNSYTNECAFRRTPPFPATVQSLASWVASLGHRRLQVKSIKSYITGVRSAQLDIGATRAELEVFHHPSLERLVNGIKRLQGEAGRRERRPITRPILLQMLALLNQDTLHGATFHAAFSLAFAAFLRIGEFTHSAALIQANFRNRTLPEVLYSWKKIGWSYLCPLPRRTLSGMESPSQLQHHTTQDVQLPLYDIYFGVLPLEKPLPCLTQTWDSHGSSLPILCARSFPILVIQGIMPDIPFAVEQRLGQKKWGSPTARFSCRTCCILIQARR